MNKVPDRAGLWEWFCNDGSKVVIPVCNVFDNFPDMYPYYRVYYRGGYYNVADEWTHGTWGKYLGNSVDENVC